MRNEPFSQLHLQSDMCGRHKLPHPFSYEYKVIPTRLTATNGVAKNMRVRIVWSSATARPHSHRGLVLQGGLRSMAASVHEKSVTNVSPA